MPFNREMWEKALQETITINAPGKSCEDYYCQAHMDCEGCEKQLKVSDEKRKAMDVLIEKIKCAHALLENMDHDKLALAILDSPVIRAYFEKKT